MTTPPLYQALAAYNAAMNTKIYDACAGISDAERKADRGAFFRSIHSTLNHLLFGDKAWMGRLRGRPEPLPPIGTDIHEAFDDLRAAREAMDAEIIRWTEGLTDEWLGEQLEWTSSVDGKTRHQPRWLLTTHMFNHQTHHRGQLTTLLSQSGIDIGSTDIPFLVPSSVVRAEQ